MELGLEGLVASRGHADAFQVPEFGLGLADCDRCGARPDRRLALEPQHRKRCALRGRVEDAELHRPRVAALVPGPISHHAGLRFPGGAGDDLAQGLFGGAEVTGHLDMGHIQRLPDLVEAVGHAVLGQMVPQLEPRRMEEIPQGLLILVPVHPALHRAPFPGDLRAFCRQKCPAEKVGEGGQLRAGWTGLLFRRHLTLFHPVVHRSPAGAVGGDRGSEVERCQVQAALVRVRVMAFQAVAFEEGLDRLRCGCRPGSSESDSGRQDKEEASGVPDHDGVEGISSPQPTFRSNRHLQGIVRSPGLAGRDRGR